ncbi:hypothetical protein G6011_07779 [Alternaria panax]|uniref:Dicer-like protein 2 n=1 Tax=Alternaria panax TaxID=48097 RepID=A0AAD4I157_9PLEO|nr:hypothetical protein G6011_07779 [Alternaria panax]
MQDDNDAGVLSAVPSEAFQLRGYQAEMVAESMRDNVIVVMDTGSGKTHIAIERTRAELETCEPGQVVWFLAPTVALCEQQYDVFQSNLPSVGHQLLCGRDDVELWTTQTEWDRVLFNVRVVISTHAILLDALTHGFVRLRMLALLIFDEAHHCTLKHPAHLIMSDFYIPQLMKGGTSLPKVLGLSASPVMKAAASAEGLRQIEQNLHATVKTPKLHRSELIQYAHRPELLQITYSLDAPGQEHSHLLLALQHVYRTYDLAKDPYVIALLDQQKNGFDVSRQLTKLWNSQKTYCHDQLKQLVSKAEAMAEELGVSAMEYYLHQCIARFEKMILGSDQQLLDLTNTEKQYLLKIFQGLPLQNPAPIPATIIEKSSHKVNKLVDTLVAEANGTPGFTGLVFIEQRVWVASLAEILACHPRTRDLLRVGTFVGSAKSSKQKANISALAEPKNQQTTLDDLRAGVINLILATTVLEEGIDVSSCHLVVCFERPKNLKSFVQRRGRARQQKSRYLIFVPDTGEARSSTSWQSLEAEMRKAYEDDKRRVSAAHEAEQTYEVGERQFRIPNTGALLTLENASQHLYHFCARLGSSAYVDTRPEIEFTNSYGQITAEITLPLSVDPKVRKAKSLEKWRTERMAQKDAAFEAYKALYLHELVNENLLPVQGQEDDAAQYQIPDDRPSLVPVSPTLDPWSTIAQVHQHSPDTWYRTLLEAKALGEEPIRMILLTPAAMHEVSDILLHWNKSKRYTVTTSCLYGTSLTDINIGLLRSVTWKILRSVFGAHIKEGVDDFLCLLAPCDTLGYMMTENELREWHATTDGQRSASKLLIEGNLDAASWGLTVQQGDHRKFMPLAIERSGSPDLSGGYTTSLQAVRLPKRRDFLHIVYQNTDMNDAYTKVESLLASTCIVENLPAKYAILALLFPSILHKLEVHMIADTLRTTLLEPAKFEVSDLPIIITALTSSAVDAHDNYQRMEFLGDCILKFVASLHVMAANLLMPEGMLTGKKGKLVSNGYLARATLAAGLDKFILYKQFTGAKWKPRYIAQTLADIAPPSKQEKSSKLIADVIESLIGASYIVGGFPKAFGCMQALLPLEKWTPISEAHEILYNAAPSDDRGMNLVLLEKLLGHTFNKKELLLEALTHSTFRGPNIHCSYERFEFLGDAVLEYIISKRLYAHESNLQHWKMHGIRTAMVNAAFLSYCMFETTVAEELTNKATLQPEIHHRALWQFLRSSSSELIAARTVALQQHVETRDVIATALAQDKRFPWHALSLTDPPKFLSDIVESVLGALYIDSHGSIPVCEDFVRRLGILPCLERILRDGVDCFHPKERINTLAANKGIKYVRVANEIEGKKNGTNGSERGYKVQVRIGGKDVGGVVEGVKRLQAETIAAWKVIALLERGDAGDVPMETDEDDDDDDDEFFDADDGSGVMLEGR